MTKKNYFYSVSLRLELICNRFVFKTLASCQLTFLFPKGVKLLKCKTKKDLSKIIFLQYLLFSNGYYEFDSEVLVQFYLYQSGKFRKEAKSTDNSLKCIKKKIKKIESIQDSIILWPILPFVFKLYTVFVNYSISDQNPIKLTDQTSTVIH